MKLCFFILITLSATPLGTLLSGSYVVVWNVGQGQWVTAVDPLRCRHFDMGGEFFPWQRIHFACANKENQIYLSHWDWDHIGALAKKKQLQKLSRLCLALPPQGKASPYKRQLLADLPLCPEKLLPVWTPQLQKDSNANSHVLRTGNTLIPGDSPKALELIWQNQPWVKGCQVLILGHHGSRTSTSQELINTLPRLQLGIASARWNRYRHPHPSVQVILKNRKIPLLRTEDWGHIWLEQKPSSL